jgi:hypothetical protein
MNRQGNDMENNAAIIDEELDFVEVVSESNNREEKLVKAVLFKTTRKLSEIEKDLLEEQQCAFDSLRGGYVCPLLSKENLAEISSKFELDLTLETILVHSDYFAKTAGQRKKESQLDLLQRQELELDTYIRSEASKIGLTLEDLKGPISTENKSEINVSIEKILRKKFKELQKIRTKIAKIQSSVGQKENTTENANSFLIEPGHTDLAADKGCEILANPNCGVFQQRGRIVKIIAYQTEAKKKASVTTGEDEKKKIKIRRPIGALTLAECNEIDLIYVLNRRCTWLKQNARFPDPRPTDFPDKAAKMILSKHGSGLPVLKGFVCCPTIREDGSLLENPGYDEESGLFFNPCGTEFPKIPEAPSIDDAREALSILKDLIKDFPFADNVSKAVALAEMMTAVIRRSLDLAPGFANDASTRSSGKTLLAKLGSLIATGKEPTLIIPTQNEEEFGKRIGAAFIAGDPIICVDNLDFALESRDLCVILTAAFFNPRILGQSKAPDVATNSQIIFTGNNLVFKGDICTRILMCRLLPDCEHPEERKFDRNLEVYTPANRGALVAAILTLIRAFLVAGCPGLDSLVDFRTYSSWTKFVRGPLVWLGEVDPYESTRSIKEADPEKEEISSLLSAWYFANKHFLVDAMTVRDLCEFSSNSYWQLKNELWPAEVQQLHEVLLDIAPAGNGKVNTTKLGNKIQKFKDRIIDSHRLTAIGSSKRAVIWKVSKI